MSELNPDDLDAERLYRDLRVGVGRLMLPGRVMVGIWSGGAWLAERLFADLCGPAAPGAEGCARSPGAPGVLSSALHRDDFGERGLAGGNATTHLPFEIDGAHIVLIDDVMYTGRTARAAINELFDYGRPASVELAVLVDRGGRHLPFAPTFAATRVTLPESRRLSLARDPDGRLRFSIGDA
jgi:pyrimidine operon attenuation protein/uracil phosphoribosyltransferase